MNPQDELENRVEQCIYFVDAAIEDGEVTRDFAEWVRDLRVELDRAGLSDKRVTFAAQRLSRAIERGAVALV